MLLANWLQVYDAPAFLHAFAGAAEKTRGWKLDSIKTDYGHQFVYIRYTGRKFAGKGLMASAFASLSPRERAGVRADFKHQYRDCQGAVLGQVDAPTYASAPMTSPSASPIRTPSASAERSTAGKKSRPSLALRVPMELHSPLQRVNITLRADQWPTHVYFNNPAEDLIAPLIRTALRTNRRRQPLQ